MLQSIRDRAQGWIAWVIVILISIPFALWGIQSYLGINGETVTATVNGVELTERDLDRRVQQTRMELRERLGAAYDPAAFDSAELRRMVREEMIREVLLIDVSQRLGLRVSDQELKLRILSEPAFQRDGRFDNEAFQRLLQLQGMSEQQFVEQLRRQLTGTQLIRAVVASEFPTRLELEQFQRLSAQQRDIDYARFAAADYLSDEPIADETIETYYQEHAERFRSPEQVKLDYVVLDVADLAKGIEIDEAALREAYAAEQGRFVMPEQRQVRHLLIALPQQADDEQIAAAEREITALRARILEGESFADLAAEHSDDPGSAAEGGELGLIEPGMMDPVFDEAVFSLPEGGLSEPVRTRFGYHLIEVEAVRPGETQPFEAVREQLHEEQARAQAESLYYDLGERLATLSYERPDSLEPVVEELGLELRQSDWIGREGGEGLLAEPGVLSAAFSDEVLVEGNNSELIEPDHERLSAVVVRVRDHRESAQRPLETVREEIVAALREQRAQQAAMAAAEAALAQVRDGEAEWSEAMAAAVIESAGLVGRGAVLPEAVLDLAFKLPAPQSGEAELEAVTLADGDAVVVRLTQVEDGEVTVGADGATIPEAGLLAELAGRDLYDAVLADIERRAEITREPLSVDDDQL
ncbi:SurA N-terminal domain-containing protein [Marichromatium gracile]|uniref:SurA N-terminal domain-containing protein n=1 Tax=Marichromatium gracile TaxID=1048 RepID=UPI001F243640|nr:SurA N-terminal domain-containing protein [Marichromatium gracile]MCF1184081.1 SurA N-terminal domain-containing protein [Marichromatium gracile]